MKRLLAGSIAALIVACVGVLGISASNARSPEKPSIDSSAQSGAGSTDQYRALREQAHAEASFRRQYVRLRAQARAEHDHARS